MVRRGSERAGWRTSWPATDSARTVNATSLEHWECGQDRVALIMHNDLYPDMVIGCLKARTVPVNVNYNYTPREIAELLEYLKPRAVIYHRSLGAKFADVLPTAQPIC